VGHNPEPRGGRECLASPHTPDPAFFTGLARAIVLVGNGSVLEMSAQRGTDRAPIGAGPAVVRKRPFWSPVSIRRRVRGVATQRVDDLVQAMGLPGSARTRSASAAERHGPALHLPPDSCPVLRRIYPEIVGAVWRRVLCAESVSLKGAWGIQLMIGLPAQNRSSAAGLAKVFHEEFVQTWSIRDPQ
jgi:hypothetical protein